MKKNLLLTLMILLMMATIAGCSATDAGENGAAAETIQEKAIADDQFLLFANTDVEGELGDLYIQKGTGEKEKIASDVQDYNYTFLAEQNAVVFFDKDSQLLIKHEGEETETISSEAVAYYEVLDDESGVTFVKGDTYDLYLYKWGEEKEKIASDVSDYICSNDGTVIAFIDDEDNLYYVAEGAEKEKIASDVIFCMISDDNSSIYYVNDDSDLYYRNFTAVENEKIASGELADISISADGKNVTYLNEYDYEKGRGELYLASLENGADKIASDVTYYESLDDGDVIYYVNTENNLMVCDTKKDEKEKIASEIMEFTCADADTVFFLDEEDNLYIREKGKEREKIASDVYFWNRLNDQVVFTTEEGDLYLKEMGKEKEKIASEVEYYAVSLNGNSIAYYTDDHELMMKNKGEEKIKILDSVEEYYEVSLGNQLMYVKTLLLDDIEGIWVQVADPDFVVEIDGGKLKPYYYGEMQGETDLEMEGYSLNSGTMTIKANPDYPDVYDEDYYMDVELISENEIMMDFETFTKITKEELDQKLAEQKDQMAKEQAAAEKQRELDNKIAEAYSIGDDILYTYQVISNYNANFRDYPSMNGELLGTLNYGNEFFIEDTYVDENGLLWCYVGAYDEYYNYIGGWCAYINFQ